MDNRVMKIFPLVGFLFLLLCTPALVSALNFPQTNVPINDYAKVIPPEYEARMDRLARALWDKTGTALVVATFPDLGGESPRIFANRLYEAWGIGKSGEDKGVLLLVAVKERQVTFETGYGVERILPDTKMGDILDQYVVPFLRRDEYGEGLLNGMAAVAQVVTQNAGVKLNLDRYAPGATVKPKGWGLDDLLLLFFVVLFVVFGFLGRRRIVLLARSVYRFLRGDTKKHEAGRDSGKKTRSTKQDKSRSQDENDRHEEKRWRSEQRQRQRYSKDEQYYRALLGLPENFTWEDVKRHHRALAAKYHPDKVNHLGDKLKELAQSEMKEINESYDFFRKKYEI